MSSAWLRTPRLNEPDEFREHESQAQRFEARRAAADRFGEFMPPRATERQTCGGCAGTGTVGEFACPACGGKGYRNVFVEERKLEGLEAANRPVHGASREAVIGPAFMPGSPTPTGSYSTAKGAALVRPSHPRISFTPTG